MNYSIFFIILTMAVVTYIPRALPAVIINKLSFSRKAEKFLQLIPYTAMAALIFPGILTTDISRPEVGILGGIVATFLAYLKCPVIVCVIAAIVANMLLYSTSW